MLPDSSWLWVALYPGSVLEEGWGAYLRWPQGRELPGQQEAMAGTQERWETAEGHGRWKPQGGETVGPRATWASTPGSFTLAVALTGLLSLCFPIPCGKLLPPESRGKRERDGWIASSPSSETGRPSDEHPILSERH